VGAVALVAVLLAGIGISGLAARGYVLANRALAELEGKDMLPFDPATLPRARLCAFLAVQDPTFFRHRGIGLLDGKPGHTTVTQAIGKWMLFERFSPGALRHRKIALMFGALGIDAALSKEDQLRLFLNRSYFGTYQGAEILGLPAASRAYFGKDALALTDEQYLALLAMLDAPNRDHAVLNPEGNRAKAEVIAARIATACRPGCFERPAPAPCKS
jgi:membrane carboxypeptidase/penicillin-binding protein